MFEFDLWGSCIQTRQSSSSSDMPVEFKQVYPMRSFEIDPASRVDDILLVRDCFVNTKRCQLHQRSSRALWESTGATFVYATLRAPSSMVATKRCNKCLTSAEFWNCLRLQLHAH